MGTFEVKYKKRFGKEIVAQRYNTVSEWFTDKGFLYFSRQDSPEFLIVRKEDITHIKYEKQ